MLLYSVTELTETVFGGGGNGTGPDGRIAGGLPLLH